MARGVIAEAWVSLRNGPYGVCGGQTDDGAHFVLSTSLLPRRHYFIIAPYSALLTFHRGCMTVETASIKLVPFALSHVDPMISTYVVGSNSFRPDQLFKVKETKQLAVFQRSLPLFQHTFQLIH